MLSPHPRLREPFNTFAPFSINRSIDFISNTQVQPVSSAKRDSISTDFVPPPLFSRCQISIGIVSSNLSLFTHLPLIVAYSWGQSCDELIDRTGYFDLAQWNTGRVSCSAIIDRINNTFLSSAIFPFRRSPPNRHRTFMSRTRTNSQYKGCAKDLKKNITIFNLLNRVPVN